MSVTPKTKMIDGVPHLLNEEDMTYYPTITEDEQTGLTYTLDPDTFTYIPNLTVGDAEDEERPIGIWGERRRRFLENHKEWLYLELFDSHKLTDHLIEIDEAAENLMDELTEKMMKQEGVTEQLKAADQMEWVRRANSIQNRAEEIVYSRLIYT